MREFEAKREAKLIEPRAKLLAQRISEQFGDIVKPMRVYGSSDFCEQKDGFAPVVMLGWYEADDSAIGIAFDPSILDADETNLRTVAETLHEFYESA